jgi:outer membrane protein assembly factor BamE (lipoprotein component of BamABCDE complex)
MLKKIFAPLFVSLLLANCTPTPHMRGNFVEDEQLKKLTIGQTTAQQVHEILGPPSSRELFVGRGWYYMGEKTETVAFLKPKVQKRHFYLLEFDDKEILISVKKFDEKGIEISPDSSKTPTYGRDPSFLGEFINNIGRYEDPGARPRRKS